MLNGSFNIIYFNIIFFQPVEYIYSLFCLILLQGNNHLISC